MDDYLQRILRARVYEVAKQTPLELAQNLSHRLNNQVWLKREDLQSVFSFKLVHYFIIHATIEIKIMD